MADRGSTLVRDGDVPVTVDGSGDRVRVGVDLVGRELLHFRVVARLGAGGMGVVYKAIDQKLRRAVALKVLAARYVADERNKELIFREARSAASLAHPNIAAIHELHDTPDGAFFVMELVDGETLRARLARDGRFALRDALGFAAQIARALARAHEAGVVHRDLKADNVMVTRGGELKLLDFGLAKVVGLADHASIGDAAPHSHSPGLAPTVDAAARATEAGRVMGTPASMAPEQARGERVDARADVFAFGVLLYEMLAGAAPFPPRDGVPSGEASSGDWAIVVPVAAAAPRTPALVQHIVTRCLAFDRADRYPDGAALVHAIDACAPRARRSRLAIAAVALGLATAAGVTAFALTRNTGDTPDLSAACDSTPRLDALWPAAARATFVGTKFGDEDLATYDTFAATWRTQHHDACLVAAAEPTRALGQKQLTCLDAAVDDLAAQLARPRGDVAWGHARPALPPLSRCAGDAPGRPAVVQRLARSMEMGVGFALSPDGTHYAVRANGRLVVTSIATNTDDSSVAVPPRSAIAGWGSEIVLYDHDQVMFADPAHGTLRMGPALPPGVVSLSPDGARALVVDGPEGSARNLRLLTLADGTRSASLLEIAADWHADPFEVGDAAWSPGTQIALPLFSPDDGMRLVVLDLATGRSTSLPLRLDVHELGGVILAWADDHHLRFGGRSEAASGGGIWQLTAHGGVVDGPLVLALPAPPETLYNLATVAPRTAGRALASTIAVHRDLVRVRAGTSEHVAFAPVVEVVWGLDASAEHVFVQRSGHDAGFVSLATGAYTKLGGGAAEPDGDRVLEPDGDVIRSFDLRTGHDLGTIRSRGKLIPHATRCAVAAPGHCAVKGTEAGKPWIARLDGNVLGDPIAVDTPGHFAISADGRRVAFASTTPSTIEILELATGHRERWPAPTPPGCGVTQFFAWGRGGDAVYVTALCGAGFDANHVLRVTRDKPPVDVYATSQAFIAGLAVGPADDLIVGLRSFSASLVLIDGLDVE